MENPTSILSLNPALFDFSAGILVGALSLLIIIQRKKMNLWATMDALTIPLAVFWVFLGFSHLASGKLYGMPTNLPWGIELLGETRHPTQVYEMLFSGGILFYMIRKVKSNDAETVQATGVYFLEFVSFSSLAWIVIETFRADTLFFISNIRTLQVVALLILVSAFWLINHRINELENEDEANTA
jgi:prolipoprotein diacylglyceryltransferase